MNDFDGVQIQCGNQNAFLVMCVANKFGWGKICDLQESEELSSLSAKRFTSDIGSVPQGVGKASCHTQNL